MYKINKDQCIECGFCQSICPKSAISISKDYAYEIGTSCIACGLCLKHCPVNAIFKIGEAN